MLTEPFSPGVRSVPVRRRGDQLDRDLVVVEEPLEIQVDGRPLVVTMRTPGHDEELAAGFLYAEGVISRPEEVTSLRSETGSGRHDARIRVAEFSGDRVYVSLRDGAASHPGANPTTREFRATAACGVCGKTEIDDLDAELPPVAPVATDPGLLETLPSALRGSQVLFESTGGIHAAGLCALDGSLLCVREDIGRHNAVDKLIGHFVLKGEVPLSDRILVVSGRAGFELVQKALKAAIPVMVSVGAASSLAVQMATDAGMTLYSFAGPGHGNLHIREPEPATDPQS